MPQGTEGRRQRIKNTLLFHLALLALRCLRRLPRWLLPSVSCSLGGIALMAAAKERRQALANIRRVWPELPRHSAWCLALRSAQNLARSLLECALMSRGLVPHVCYHQGSDSHLHHALRQGRGVIYVTGHYGNWELMAAAIARIAPVYVLARRSYDPRFTAILRTFREDFGITCLWVEAPGHLRRAIRALRQGAILGVLVDAPPGDEVPHVPFLGHLAPTSALPATLARCTGAPVVSGTIHRQGRNRHAITLRPVRLDSRRIAGKHSPMAIEACNALLEEQIRRYPSQWTWSLDRWRLPPSPKRPARNNAH